MLSFAHCKSSEILKLDSSGDWDFVLNMRGLGIVRFLFKRTECPKQSQCPLIEEFALRKEKSISNIKEGRWIVI